MDAIAMRTDARPLGRSALRAFLIAYGCWRFAGTNVATARARKPRAAQAG